MRKYFFFLIFLQGIKIKKKVYIIGSGVSGLSAAVHALKKDYTVNIFESSALAGGRCRSFYEKKLGFEIDNGNHLVFSANRNFYELCKDVGSLNTLKTLPPSLDFFDLKKKLYWNLDLEKITLPQLIFNRKKIIPDANLYDYLSILKFLQVGSKTTVFDLVGKSKIFPTFWNPLTLAVMNTSCKMASAKVLSNVIKKTLFKGKDYCKIYQPKNSWNESIIKPCIKFLANSGHKINFKTRLKNVNIFNKNVSELVFDNRKIKIKKDDLVILAIPPSNFSKILLGHQVPTNYNSIINIHYKLSEKLKKKFKNPIIGFLNSNSHWIFLKKEYISVTISNANSFNTLDSSEIADMVWKEICSYMKIIVPITNYQVIKEKKATFVQSPSNFELVRKLKNLPKNIRIVGDWTQFNFPCTIEGSVFSGKQAII